MKMAQTFKMKQQLPSRLPHQLIGNLPHNNPSVSLWGFCCVVRGFVVWLGVFLWGWGFFLWGWEKGWVFFCGIRVLWLFLQPFSSLHLHFRSHFTSFSLSSLAYPVTSTPPPPFSSPPPSLPRQPSSSTHPPNKETHHTIIHSTNSNTHPSPNRTTTLRT